MVLKFKFRKPKRKILIDRKNRHNKYENLSQLNLASNLFISESMCHENYQLAYKCTPLKNAGKIHSTWFWYNAINVKLNERSQPAKIYHIDIGKLLGVDNLDNFRLFLFSNFDKHLLFLSFSLTKWFSLPNKVHMFYQTISFIFRLTGLMLSSQCFTVFSPEFSNAYLTPLELSTHFYDIMYYLLQLITCAHKWTFSVALKRVNVWAKDWMVRLLFVFFNSASFFKCL